MKKSNLITILSFVILIVMVVLFMLLGKTPSVNYDSDADNSLGQNDTISVLSTDLDIESGENAETETDTTELAESKLENEKTEPITDTTEEKETENTLNEKKEISASMDDALFIGDSRTVGLSEYAGIEGADFFATIGMSVYNIHKNSLSVPAVGKVTLTELLDNKKYGKIYVMLGINEVGYKYDSTVSKYKELIEMIKEKEPEALIFIQANVHVTQSRSESDKVVNNKAINELNTKLSELADGKKIFYLDANVLFDDVNGNLSSDKAGDSAHLYAKYYSEWGEWIVNQTRLLIEEG